MPNSLQYASVFQSELDKAAVEQATSGWMEPNSSLVKYTGGNTVKVPILNMDGLADYSNGFTDGDIKLTWQDLEFTMDRGRRFALDEHEVNDTNFVVTASQVMGEFQRTKVVPEIDAYRYSTIAAGTIAKKRASGGYTPSATDILRKLYYDIAAVQDVVGSGTPMVITMSATVAAILDTSTEISKRLDVVDFTQGGVTLKVSALNGEHPIRRVGSGRLKSAYVFADGKTDGQKSGGFTPAEGALDVNWIICPRTVPIAVSRTDKVRVFDPETYQGARAWVMDYRKYHDLWITDNKWPQIWVNFRQALPAGQ